MNKFLATIIALGSITSPAFAEEALKEVRTTREAIEIETKEAEIDAYEKTLKELEKNISFFKGTEYCDRKSGNGYQKASLTVFGGVGTIYLVRKKMHLSNNSTSKLIFVGGALYGTLLGTFSSSCLRSADRNAAKIELTEENIAQLKINIDKALKNLAKKKELLKAAKADFEG